MRSPRRPPVLRTWRADDSPELAALIRRSTICLNQFRSDAPGSRPRSARSERIRADGRVVDRSLSAPRRRAAGELTVLAMLSSGAQPLPAQSRVHACDHQPEVIRRIETVLADPGAEKPLRPCA